jgi:hypothetical protein
MLLQPDFDLCDGKGGRKYQYVAVERSVEIREERKARNANQERCIWDGVI